MSYLDLEESNQRIQYALDELWMYTNELFHNSSAEIELEKEGIAVLSSSLENEWRKKTKQMARFHCEKIQVPQSSSMTILSAL